jgi:hypothetical protein
LGVQSERQPQAAGTPVEALGGMTGFQFFVLQAIKFIIEIARTGGRATYRQWFAC